jgi:hypothetical protein
MQVVTAHGENLVRTTASTGLPPPRPVKDGVLRVGAKVVDVVNRDEALGFPGL